MSVAARDIDDYLAELPEEARAVLEALRRAIQAAAPDATESISYQMPTFNYRGPLVASTRGALPRTADRTNLHGQEKDDGPDR